MISSEIELRCSVEWMAKMYGMHDRELEEPTWDQNTRNMMAEQTENMRLKIEREVAEYLARKYHYLPDAESPVESSEDSAAQEKAA